MRMTWRTVELRMLLPLLILVPLGFVITNVAQADALEPGPLGLAIGYVAIMLGAHLVLTLAGNRGDQLLLPLVATIGGIGLIFLNRLPQDLAGTSALGVQLDMAATQLLWFGVGVVAMLAIAVGFRDDGLLRHYKYTWAMAGAALLVITFVFGTELYGARLWLNIGPVQFQPGEFIKIVLVVFIAGYLADNRALLSEAVVRIGPIKIPPLPYLLPMIAIFVLVMLMVVIMKDLGTALLFFGIFLTMLFVATGRRSYVLIGLLLFLAGSFVAYEAFGHVRERIDVWLNPFENPTGPAYQTVQAIYAFSRGGLFGEGIGQGLLPGVGGSFPAIQTDFIFAAIGEELGLVGAFALLAFALLLVFRGLRIAMLAHDDFSGMLSVGLTVSLGLQTLIIVGGNAKLIPLTGVTFPFVSYGGSSLLASFMVVGLLLAVSDRSQREAAREESP
jgi:peptidoglycan glycosyltransferase